MTRGQKTKFDEAMEQGAKISYIQKSEKREGLRWGTLGNASITFLHLSFISGITSGLIPYLYSVHVVLLDGTLENFSNVHPARVDHYIQAAKAGPSHDVGHDKNSVPPTRETETDRQWETEQWMFRKREHEDYGTVDCEVGVFFQDRLMC